MKRTLQPQLVQNWTLIGLKPMHRALVRSTAQTSAANSNKEFAAQWIAIDRDRALLPANNTSETSASHPSIPSLAGPGVVIVDRDIYFDQIGGRLFDPRISSCTEDRSPCQIRLLWSWSLRGKRDLLWCTELNFDGVIHDIQSLQQWTRACLKHAKVLVEKEDSLISGIRLPPL